MGITLLPVEWAPGAFPPGVVEAGHEAYHAPLSIYEVKNMWSYTTTSPYKFMAWFLTTDRGQL
jgi:hypothetical protein